MNVWRMKRLGPDSQQPVNVGLESVQGICLDHLLENGMGKFKVGAEIGGKFFK